MAPNSHCTACMRLFHRQLQHARQPPALIPRSSSFSSRRFSLFPSLLSSQPSKNPTPAPKSSHPLSNPGPKHVDFGQETSPSQALGISLAAEVRKRAPAMTETYVAYGACDALVKECARQADYSIPQALEKRGVIPKTKDGEDLGVGSGPWYEVLGLTPTFNTWAQVTFLHMYALMVRMRTFPATHAPTWHQHLVDHFFYNAEERMIKLHRISAGSIRNKYLKDLFLQWRGLLAAYDEGLARGSDAVLATAIWRNVFKADEEVDLRSLGLVVSYLRGILNGLESMDDEGLTRGEVVFGDLATQMEEIMVRSRMMERPLEKGEGSNATEKGKREEKGNGMAGATTTTEEEPKKYIQRGLNKGDISSE